MKRVLPTILCLFVCSILQAQYKITPIVGTGADRVVNPYHYQTQRSGNFTNASVSCAHPLAAMIGAEIMKDGGNAFDAMIATQLALAVVYPEAGNLGGGGFLVAHTAFGKNISIDYRETAPAKATRDMYLDQDGNPQLNLSQAGHLACGVPGTVAGLFATYQYARLPIRILIQPAIDLADSGFVITEREANNLNNTKASFQQNSTTPSAFVKETPWKAGDTLVQKELAKTLKSIRDNGEKGFYEGVTAKLLVEEM
jgi:gamma-glutamyltranspeptidase/glutathione hydrolase